MVETMSDISRQQKVASAKKKLRKFQKARSPVNGEIPENGELGREILRGIQNNHIFKTPPLTVPKSQNSPVHTKSFNGTPSLPTINQKLNFSNAGNSPMIGVERSMSPSPTNDISPLISGPSLDSPPADTHMLNGFVKPDEIEEQIATYKRSNLQLSNQVQEQRKQILKLQERLKKENTSGKQLIEQRALKEQLEVHIQTIGILVSEKSELQSSAANIQKKLSTKDKEMNEINEHLQHMRQHVVELEKNITFYKASSDQLKQSNKELISERDRFSAKLYEASHHKDDFQQQNSELHAKLQVKVEECAMLLNQVNDLHVKLQKGELMIQQLSVNTSDSQAIIDWQEKKEALVKTIEEQKNIVRKLVSDKAEILEKHSDAESHYELQIEQLKNKINLLEAERHSLLEKSQSLNESLINVQNELASTSQASTITTPIIESPVNSSISNEEHQTMVNQKESLEKELDIQINENRRLGRVIFEQNIKIEELESNAARLNAESVDKLSLLNQIQADKETISRALTQNKSLKEQLEELEKGFVKMSNSSADLTSKLESEQHGNKDVASKLSETQIELEETKIKLHDKSMSCDSLTTEIQKFKEEVHNVQMKLASKEMDLDLLNTELETVKHDISLHEMKNHHSNNSTDLTQILQQELQSAQDTINNLSYQNIQLKESLEEAQSQTTEHDDGSLYPGRQHSLNYPHGDSASVSELSEEELHAKSWEELEGDDDDDEYLNESQALRITNEQVDHMKTSLQQLQEEREKILFLLQDEREKSFKASERIEEHVELQVQQQLKQKERELQEHFYEQTEALHNKVQSLQEALEIMRKNEDIADFDMTSDGITMPLLKTAFMQLQKRYKSAMDAKAQLSDSLEQLEHVNMKLESETETIGEYIALYQTQREALKVKFSEKDQIITQLSNEHGRMQTKVSQLHQLVMQMLSDRSGIESKNKQLQELVNRRLALQSGDSHNAEVPKLQYNLDNLFGQMTLTPEEENELIKDNITVDESIHDSLTNDETTQQILQIFEQLETTGEGYQYGWLSPAARKHDFKPCRNCTGSLIYL